MTDLREFARQSQNLARLDVRLVAISVDDQQRPREASEKAANKKFTILSDAGASVIRKYGLLHEHGAEGGEDIALRTAILIGPDGRERWRRVSKSVPDIPSWKETLTQIKAGTSQCRCYLGSMAKNFASANRRLTVWATNWSASRGSLCCARSCSITGIIIPVSSRSYLRLLDVPVSVMSGRSADENRWDKTVQRQPFVNHAL